VTHAGTVCAGDLHFYMRHSYQPTPAKAAEEAASPAAADAQASGSAPSAPGKQGLPRVNSFQRAASAGKSLANLVRGRSPSPARAPHGPRSSSPAAVTRTQSSSKGSRAPPPALGGHRRRGDPGTVMDPALVLDMYSDLLPAQSPLHSVRSGGAIPTAAPRHVAPSRCIQPFVEALLQHRCMVYASVALALSGTAHTPTRMSHCALLSQANLQPLPVLCCSRPAGSLTRTADVIEQRGVLRGAPPAGFSRFGSGPSPPHLEVDGSSDAGSVSGISGGAGQVGATHHVSQAWRAFVQHSAREYTPSCAATLPSGLRIACHEDRRALSRSS